MLRGFWALSLGVWGVLGFEVSRGCFILMQGILACLVFRGLGLALRA